MHLEIMQSAVMHLYFCVAVVAELTHNNLKLNDEKKQPQKLFFFSKRSVSVYPSLPASVRGGDADDTFFYFNT